MNTLGPIPCSTVTHTSTRPAHCSCSACPILRAPGRWWSERGGGSRSSRSPCARSSCSCYVAASVPGRPRSPTRRALTFPWTPPGTVHSSAEVTPPLERAAPRPGRLYAVVAACAVVVYLGALWNRFAVDDLPIIVLNPLVADPAGMWRAFAAPYWPPDLGGHMYRPLVIASFALDHLIDGTAWFHAVNLLWHAGVAVAVAAWHGAGRTMRARSLRDCCSPYIPCTWRRWRTSWAGPSSWPRCSRCSPCTRASCARALGGARRRWAWASSPRKTPRSRRRSSLSRGCSGSRGRSVGA